MPSGAMSKRVAKISGVRDGLPVRLAHQPCRGDDRVALLDGLIDELEFVVLDIGARECDRAGHGKANEHGLKGARVIETLRSSKFLDVLTGRK